MKAQWSAGTDGSRDLLRTFYDVERLEVCSFQEVPGGAVCMPVIGDALFYADSKCMVPALVVPPGSCSAIDDVPKYIRSASGCAGDLTVYYRGAQIHAPAVVYTFDEGGCAPQSVQADWLVFVAGGTVDLGQFVAGDVMTELFAD